MVDIPVKLPSKQSVDGSNSSGGISNSGGFHRMLNSFLLVDIFCGPNCGQKALLLVAPGGMGISHPKQFEMFAGSGDAPPDSTFTHKLRHSNATHAV